MSIRCSFVFVLLTSFIELLTAQLTYDCRRLNDCVNNSTCNHVEGTALFKQCVCPGEFEGISCSVKKVDKCPDNGLCKNGGICHTTNKCSCPYGYYGDTCELEIVDIKCSGSLNITMVFPEVFEGTIYVDNQQNCSFKSVTENGLDKFSIYLPFDNTGCGAHVNKTTNDTTGDPMYEVRVVVQYSQMYMTAVDELHTLKCTLRGNTSLYSDLIGQAVDTAGNLTQSVKDQEYTLVEMVVEDDNKSPLQQGTKLYVGQPFVLYFKLTDNSVYKSMRIDRCEANNTLPGSPDNKRYLILDSGCGTAKGAKVIRALQNERKQPNDLPGAELKLRAFKFIDSDNVGFVCSVKLCKTGNETGCAVRNQSDCSDITAGTSGRRKRAAADSPAEVGQERTMTTVISVYDPRDYGASQNQGVEPSAEQCLAKSEILAAFIVLAAMVAILFLACFIFVCIFLRRRSYRKEYEPSIFSSGSSEFRIPRAHVNGAFTAM